MMGRAILLLCTLLLFGCLPVPTPPHGIGVVLDKKSFESLKPGEAHRADVLLTLGEPRFRIEKDRFFIYEWTVAYGYVIVGGYLQGYAIPVTAPHYLCLEFGQDSRLVRREHFVVAPYTKADEAIRKCTKQGSPNESLPK